MILTNDNPRDVPPEDIVADTVAGYAELVLKHNVLECSPTSPGFLQDPGRVEWTSLPFYWDACYQCEPLGLQCHTVLVSREPDAHGAEALSGSLLLQLRGGS